MVKDNADSFFSRSQRAVRRGAVAYKAFRGMMTAIRALKRVIMLRMPL